MRELQIREALDLGGRRRGAAVRYCEAHSPARPGSPAAEARSAASVPIGSTEEI